MKRVYTSDNVFDAQLVCDRLNHYGIDAMVLGTMLTGAVGELPADTRPSVWIEDDALYANARRLIAAFEAAGDPGPDWCCSACGETNGANFELCWYCARART
jgi:hypothetical protein